MRLIVTFAMGGMPWVDASVASMRDYASKVGADFHEVPDAAHVANINQPDAFNAAIANFLGI